MRKKHPKIIYCKENQQDKVFDFSRMEFLWVGWVKNPLWFFTHVGENS